MAYGTGIYKKPNVVAVKVPVFSTEKLSSVEVSLGPEMRSTGEVLGVGNNVDEAIYKGLLGAKRVHLIKDRKILVTIRDKDKAEFLPIAKSLVEHRINSVCNKWNTKIPSRKWSRSNSNK